MKRITIFLSFLLLFYNCKSEITNNKSKNNNSNRNIIELDSSDVFNFIMNKKWVYQQKDSSLSDKTFVINGNTIIYNNSIEPILCEIVSIKKTEINKYEIAGKKECYSKFSFKILDIEKEIVLWEYINLYMDINEKEELITRPYFSVYRKDKD